MILACIGDLPGAEHRIRTENTNCPDRRCQGTALCVLQPQNPGLEGTLKNIWSNFPAGDTPVNPQCRFFLHTLSKLKKYIQERGRKEPKILFEIITGKFKDTLQGAY